MAFSVCTEPNKGALGQSHTARTFLNRGLNLLLAGFYRIHTQCTPHYDDSDYLTMSIPPGAKHLSPFCPYLLCFVFCLSMFMVLNRVWKDDLASFTANKSIFSHE